MKEQLEQKLTRDFPLLYAGYNAPTTECLMAFGFECHDGWFELIYDLSAKLEPLVQQYIDEFGSENPPRAFQVKQKFGGLRFYIDVGTEKMYNLIEEAEERSLTICELCGNGNSKPRSGGWITTMCDDCFSKKGT